MRLRGQLYRLVLLVGVLAPLALCLPVMSLAQEGVANPGLAPNGLSTPAGGATGHPGAYPGPSATVPVGPTLVPPTPTSSPVAYPGPSATVPVGPTLVPPTPTSGPGGYPAPTQPFATPLPTLILPTPGLPTALPPTLTPVQPSVTPIAPVTPLPTATPPTPAPTYPPSRLANLPHLPRTRGRYVPGQIQSRRQPRARQRLPRTRGRYVPGQGGQVVAGPVQVTLPAMAHGQPLQVDVGTDTTYHWLRAGLEPQLLFSIDLAEEAPGTAIHHLTRPAELRINLAQLPGPVAAVPQLVLLHYNEARAGWEEVAAQRQGGVLSAEVSDFSTFALAQNFGRDWQPAPLLDVADSDLFTGSATFSIPLEVPPGVNGMQPQLVMTYSGLTPDEMNYNMKDLQSVEDNRSPATQADWLGLGWSLNLGRISAVVGSDCSLDNREKCSPPDYSIELNGVREDLVCVGSGCSDQLSQIIQYKTKRDTFLSIRRINMRGQPGTVPNQDKVYFEVWDKAGTYYRFGFRADSEHKRGPQSHDQTSEYRGTPWGLSLDLVQDTHGNRMEIHYFEDQATRSGDSTSYTRAAYPAVIRYTYNAAGYGSGTTLGQHYHREVRFNESVWCNSNPLDWKRPGYCGMTADDPVWRTDVNFDDAVYIYAQRYRLNDITTYVRVSTADSERKVRQYVFDYRYAAPRWTDNDSDGGTRQGASKLLLHKVWEKGFTLGVGSAINLYPNTPSYEFDYWEVTDPGAVANWLQLQWVKSAIGGRVDYAYQEFTTDLPERTSTYNHRLYRYHVSQRTLDASTTVEEKITQFYAYGVAHPLDGHMVGHAWTKVTDTAGHATTHFFITAYPLDGGHTPGVINTTGWTPSNATIKNALRGREYRVDSLEAGSGGNGEKRAVVNQFWLSGNDESRYRTVQRIRTITYLDPTVSGIISDPAQTNLTGAARLDVKAFTYDAYDNITEELECPDASAYNATCDLNTAKRRTYRAYGVLDQLAANPPPAPATPNAYRYIVDRVIKAGVYDPAEGADPWKQITFYGYDGADSDDTAPAAPTDKGRLRLVRQVSRASGECGTDLSCGSDQSADTRSGAYDAFGRALQVTTYDRWQDQGARVARTTVTEFEPTLQTFVKKVTQADADLVEEYFYTTEALRIGRPCWARDGNGGLPSVCEGDDTVTRYSFDIFGRLETMRRPGDLAVSEQVEYILRPNAPFWLVKTTRLFDDKGTTSTADDQKLVTRTFYDGLGRAIITHAPDPSLGVGTVQTVATFYDTRGLKVKETLPYQTSDSDTPAARNGSDPNLKYVTYEYDEQGALAATTRPDASQSRVIPIREQRTQRLVEQGPDFGLGGAAVQSFELDGVDGSRPCSTGGRLPLTWAAASWSGGGCAERTGNGVDRRYALKLAGGGGAMRVQSTYSWGYNAIVAPYQYSVSWLARSVSGADSTVRLSIRLGTTEAITIENEFKASFKEGRGVWELHRRTFTAPVSSNSMTLAFEVTGGSAVEIDRLGMSWGEIRERSEERDGLGRLKRVEELTGVYDAANKLYQRVKTDYTYDALDRIKSVVDHVENPTTSSWTDRTRRLTVVDPDRGSQTSDFDPNGNLTQFSDGRGTITRYSYDVVNRPLTKQYPNDAGTPAVTYTYDSGVGTYLKGRRAQMATSNGESVQYSYDRRGRVTTETRRIATWDYETRYRYNAADQAQLQKYPDGEWVKYEYNAAGAVKKACQILPLDVNNPDPQTACSAEVYLADHSYDIQGRPNVVRLGNGPGGLGVVSDYDYDAATQRLARLQTKAPSGTLVADQSYGYDTFGNVLSSSNSVASSENQGFTYDSLNRLTAVSGEFAQAFRYNELGNITQRDKVTYSYTSSKPHAVTHVSSDPAARFSYDNAGNMITRGSQTLVYDAEGRLTQVRRDATNVIEEYGYDGEGALTRRRLTAPSATTTQFSDSFTTATLNSAAWTTVGSVTGALGGGTGHPHIVSVNGAGELIRTATVSNGQVVRMAIGVSQTDSRAIWRLETSSGSYHGFGVWQRDGALVAHHFVNGVEVQRQTLMTGVTPNTWYGLELAVDDGAGMRATVWKESEAGARYEARFEMPRGIAWRFHAWGVNGVMSLDEYAEETPGGGSADSRIVGQHYEYDRVSNTQTKRYYAGGRLVATRTGRRCATSSPTTSARRRR